MQREPVINKIEIFETLHFDECGTRTRKVLINDKLVICETTSAVNDRQSESKVKHFIDWVLLVKRTSIVSNPEVLPAITKRGFWNFLSKK